MHRVVSVSSGTFERGLRERLSVSSFIQEQKHAVAALFALELDFGDERIKQIRLAVEFHRFQKQIFIIARKHRFDAGNRGRAADVNEEIYDDIHRRPCKERKGAGVGHHGGKAAGDFTRSLKVRERIDADSIGVVRMKEKGITAVGKLCSSRYGVFESGAHLGVDHDHRFSAQNRLCDETRKKHAFARLGRSHNKRAALQCLFRDPDVLFAALQAVNGSEPNRTGILRGSAGQTPTDIAVRNQPLDVNFGELIELLCVFGAPVKTAAEPHGRKGFGVALAGHVAACAKKTSGKDAA